MGLFERTHLSDQYYSKHCGGPSRGLQCNDLMESHYLSFKQAAVRAAQQLRSRCVLEKSVVPSLEEHGTPIKHFEPAMASKSFLRFQDSRPGLFSDLSTGEFYPLRIPLALQQAQGSGLRFPPLISQKKNSSLTSVTAKRLQSHAQPFELWVCRLKAKLARRLSAGPCGRSGWRGIGLFNGFTL